MKTITIRYPLSLLICLLYSLLIIPVIVFNINDVLRMILGIPFILFIPGYLLLLCFSPSLSIPSELDFLHKIAISIGLSIALVSLDGILLFYTPFGFNLPSILTSLIIIIFICGLVALYRWGKGKQQRQSSLQITIPSYKSTSKLDKILMLLLVCTIVFTIITAVVILFLPTKQESFTEFFILGASGKTSTYPKNLTVGQNSNVTIGLINYEHKPMNYTIEIWLVNQSLVYNNVTETMEYTYHEMWFLEKLNANLTHFTPDTDVIWQPQWEYLYHFNSNKTGRYTLMFLLFTSPAPEYNKQQNYKDIAATEIQNAYQSIYLWLNINK